MANIQPPNPQITFVDPKTGKLSREGFQILQSIHNRIEGAGGLAAVTAAGQYTPTFTGLVNTDTVTGSAANYVKTGSLVTVSGSVTVDAAAAGSASFGVSLPIPSNFATVTDCSGMMVSGNGAITADTSNDRANVQFTAPDGASHSYVFSFSYRII